MEINKNKIDEEDENYEIGDGNLTTGTTNAIFHGMTTTAPLDSNQQVKHISSSSTKEDIEIHSKDSQDRKKKTDDELDNSHQDHLHNQFGYPERDTRGRQYLLLTLERLSYIALENQRNRNYKVNGPLGLYILFCNQPVPCLTKNQTWPKVPNPVYSELPELIRKVQFPRKFINQTQTFFDSDHHHRLVNHHEELRNSFCTSEMGNVRGHFTYITRGFRNYWSFNRISEIKSRFPRFISTDDILGSRSKEGSRTWNKVVSALKKDRVYLESVNVWHLINLRSNPNSLFGLGQKSKSDMGLQAYQNVPTRSRSNRSVHQLYSDFINQDLQPGEIFEDEEMVLNFIDEDPPTNLEVLTPPAEERPSFIDFRIFIGENSNEYSYNKINLSSSTKFPIEEEDEYYFDVFPEFTSRRSSSDKKTVSFAPETIFIERDMDSPFWRDFAERRRRRKIMRQQRIMGNLRNRMSLFDLLKLHFRFHNKNDNAIEEISNDNDGEENIQSKSRRKSKADSKQPKCSRIAKFFSCSWC